MSTTNDTGGRNLARPDLPGQGDPIGAGPCARNAYAAALADRDPAAPALPGIFPPDVETVYLVSAGAITTRGWIASVDTLAECRADMIAAVMAETVGAE